jgi:hypothetical protein
MSTFLLGKDAEVAINSAAFSSPTWTVMYGWADVTVTDERADLPTTTRGNEFTTSDPGLRDITLEGDIPYSPSDTTMALLQAAYDARTSVDIRILDQLHTVVGAQGVRGPMKVHKFARAEPVNGVQMRSIMLKPCAPSALQSAFTTVTISS